jgi:hypothetical protein
MKKVILMLAVIAMAAPLYAADPCDVVFDGDGTGGVLVLSYTTNNGALPRGISLKCEVLGVDTVDVDSGAVITDPCFNTFIDYAFMDPCNFDVGDGHPMADPCFAGVLDPCTAVDVFSICMGVLDQTGGKSAGPDASALLISIPLTSTAGSVTIRISEDDLRGGVVGSALTTNLSGVQYIDVVVSFDCFQGTPAQVAAWIAWGKPANWCHVCWVTGDVDNDCAITFADVQQTYGDFLDPTSAGALTGRSDNDMDGAVTFADVQKVYGAFLPPTATCPVPCP